MGSTMDHPRCLGWHREGECAGCLWERECRAKTWRRENGSESCEKARRGHEKT